MTTDTGLLQDPAFSGETDIPSPPDGPSRENEWPRQLVLDDEVEERLVMYLQEEIRAAWQEREPLLKDYAKWQRQYWATPKNKVKNFPFQRAANIVVPLTATAVESVHARIMNTIWAVEPFWSVRPKTEPWIRAAKPAEDFLQTEVENENSLDLYRVSNEALMELCKLGTCVGKSGYQKDIRKTVRTLPNGEDEPIYRTIRDGAALHYVALANFLIRIAETDPQEAPWVGEEHEWSWTQLKRMASSGRLVPEAVEEIKAHWTHTRSEEHAGQSSSYHSEVDDITEQEPHWNASFKTQEIWLAFDVDGDGWDEEIVVDFHYASGTPLSIRYNWYEDLHRPYRHCRYVVMEGRFYGIGIGKMNEQFQEEITTIHRQRLDNGTLANMRMIAVRKNSGYGPDEPVFPGKMWFLDEPSKDIAPVQLSELYPSGFGNEEATLRHSEKRTGVNEVLLGMPQQGTPGTATDTLARIEEGSKRFSLVVKNVRRFFSLLGQDCLANYQQFGAGQRHFMITGDKGQWVQRILDMPQELVIHGAVVELTATDTQVNRQVEQQQWMSLFQLLQNHYATVFQHAGTLAELTGDPSVLLQIAQKALFASDEVMRRLLETFNVVGVEKMLLSGGEDGPTGPNAAGPPQSGGAGGLSGGSFPAGLEGLAAGNGQGARGSGAPSRFGAFQGGDMGQSEGS